MFKTLIRKQLFKIKQDCWLNCNYSWSYFKLEDKKNSITVLFSSNGCSLVIEVDDNIEYLGGLLDVQTLYLICCLSSELGKRHSFSIALEEMLKQYKRIKEVTREVK